MLKNYSKPVTEAMGVLLADYGFRKVAPQRFQKRTEGRVLGVHLTVVRHPEDCDVLVDLGIRFNEVEELIAKEDDKDIFTMGTEIGYLIYGKPKRWTIQVTADIEGLCIDFRKLFESHCLKYFSDYGDLKALYSLLSDPVNGPEHVPFDYLRSASRVAAAVLLRMENLEDIVEEESQKMAGKSKIENQWFLEILDVMREKEKL